MPFEVEGFSVGHWSDPMALTGCTVVLCPPNTVGGCDIRGSSPASRETALLNSEKTMQEVHAILLTGGSAFGLAAADGVMRFLEERNIGYQTPWIRVPIVPAAGIFDLNIGNPGVRPRANDAYYACLHAAAVSEDSGNIGAGTGATVGKWASPECGMKGGLGTSTQRWRDVVIGCIEVVNAVGDVVDANGNILAGARSPDGEFLGAGNLTRALRMRNNVPMANTTLVVVATNAKLSKVETNRMAQRAHDGMARSIVPVHTSFDGDIVFGLASGTIQEGFDQIAELAVAATAEAIRNAVRSAKTAGGVRGIAGE